MAKKILLIGKNGQLGGSLMESASSFGFEVIGLARKDLDVTDTIKLDNIVNETRPDILINTTAYNFVTVAEQHPQDAMAINYEAVANMAKTCYKKGILFVTYSTDYVFDGQKGVSYGEGDIPNPLQIYGKSKLAGEIGALKYNPTRSLVIRTCGVYGGEKGSSGKGNFVLNIMKEARSKEILEVSSEQVVSPTYAGDLSRATFELLQKRAGPGVYHLINEGSCSWYEFAKEILTLARIDTEIRPVDRGGLSGKMLRPKFSALKNTKAKSLGIELPSWKEGLKSYFAFLNDHEK